MRGSLSLSSRLGAGLALIALWLPASSCLAQQEPSGTPPVAQPQQLRVGEYWVGLVSEPVPDALRSQLNLPEDQGLVVEQVAPDSPAAAAALQRHDILLKADGKPLAKVPDLIAAIEAAKGKKMELQILRKGKPMKLDITPAKRPRGDYAAQVPPMSAEAWQEAMRKWAEQVRRGDPLSRDYSFVFVRPGVVLGRPGAIPDLPGNVTVSITKQGNNPAKIVVTRDSQKWEVSEGELDKLPPDLRASVEAMLRHPLRGVLAPGFEGRLLPPPSGAPAPLGPKADRNEHRPGPHASPELPKPIDKQLQDLSRQLEEMRKAVEDIKQRHPKPATAPEVVPAPPSESPK